jgi:hypothetical protein
LRTHEPAPLGEVASELGGEEGGLMIFCARATRGLIDRRKLRLRLRLSDDQSAQAYSRPLTSTLALTFRWDARNKEQLC